MHKAVALLLSLLFASSFAAAQQALPADKTSPGEAQPQKDPYPGLDLTLLDRTADPCTDLYQYSCGGWMTKNPIPADQSSWDRFGEVEERARLVLRGILEQSAAPRASRLPVEKLIGDYYAACMNEAAIEKLGAAPLKPELARIAAIKDKRQLAAIIIALHNQDRSVYSSTAPLFSFSSDQDYKDATQFIAEADQGGLGLPDRDYYLPCAKGQESCDDAKNATIREQYEEHIAKMLHLLGDSADAAAAEAHAVMQIETDLAKGHMTRVERRDPPSLYHKMTRAQFAQLAPGFDWDAYFAGIGLKDVQSLNVVAPGFFKQMQVTLNSTALPFWKAYLRWHLVHAMAPYLSKKFVSENFDFYGKKLNGTEQDQPRWKRCVRYTDRDLGEALGQAYVAKEFPPQEKQKTQAMVREIEAAMQRDINALPWMSEGTKKEALIKLHAVANKIGYPDRWRDYSALRVARNDEAGNMARSAGFEFHRRLFKIGRPVDRGEWDMTPPTVNAYYNPQMNDINFPAGILQPPLYDPAMDDAVNYGDTGATIGHELTHAFDDEGRQFDESGNLRDWWTSADADHFKQRAQCIVDQYAKYTIIDNIKINSKLTLGEDIADLGGTIIAYDAWKTSQHGVAPPAEDGYTPEQRFFIGYAQSWCTNQRPENMRLDALTDPHSPPRYRTNGVVSNMPEFQRAFSCKPGVAMVRQNACRVW
jgi:putative endopeptidase